jgi:hypothetical protein
MASSKPFGGKRAAPFGGKGKTPRNASSPNTAKGTPRKK